MWLPVRKAGLAMVLTSMLSACGVGSYSTLMKNEPAGTPFQIAQAYEYQAYAQAKSLDFQAYDAQYFADKGLKASYGQDVSPDEINQWDIKDGTKAELIQAREILMDVFLSGGVKEGLPEMSARTQMLFDCWLEQEEQKMGPYDESCRSAFYKHLEVLLTYKEPSILLAEIVKEESIEDGRPAQKIAASDLKAAFPLSYTVLFDYNKASLTLKGTQILERVASNINTLKGYETYNVVVNGHADKSGTRAYNLRLSKKRAQVVKDYLVNQGLDEEHITIFAFGETFPKINTRDGVRNKLNRRVEIIIKDDNT